MSRLRRSLPPLSALLPFEAAARLGSFSLAATELGLTQAAISRHIKALETSLEQPLFERQHRRVVLTEAGRQFGETVRTALNALADDAKALRHVGDDETVTVYAELALAAYWLVPRLAVFEERHPDISVRVITSNQSLDQVTDRFDIGMQTSPRAQQKLRPVIAVREEIFPICSPDYLARRGGAISLEALPRENLLSLRDDAFNWLDWEGFLTHFDVAPPHDANLRKHNNYAVLLQAVLSGQGIALGWRHSISRLLDSGAVVRVLDETFEVEDGVFTYTPRDLKPGTRAALVFNWIGEELRDGETRAGAGS